MDRFYIFIGRHFPEIIALLCSAFTLIVGSYLAWYYNAAWLNRAGALIIIFGVLLAALRFHEWVQEKAIDFFETNYEKISGEVLSTFDKDVGDFAESDREKIRSTVKDELKKDLSVIIEANKRRLKTWEVYLVVGGTFLNGFGDYIISLLKNP